MKIISIKKEGPELWRIKYKTLFGVKERFAIPQYDNYLQYNFPFCYRDNSETISDMGSEQIKWMIKNNVESFVT